MTDNNLRLASFLPYRLSITSNAVSEMIASRYQALFGLSVAEWRLVAVIAEQSGITQQEIGRFTRMDKVTVSRAAMALAERGIVHRLPNEDDKRSKRLTLSKIGEQLYASIAPLAIGMERDIFACLSAEERATLAELLGRVDASVDALAGNGRGAVDR
jgi:DNA-binding MarR family transcriptional regulator